MGGNGESISGKVSAAEVEDLERFPKRDIERASWIINGTVSIGN